MEQQEKEALQTQFNNSRYGKNPPEVPPTHLTLFAFDNALFCSPQLSSTIWETRTVSRLLAPNNCGPGFNNIISSLELGPLNELSKTAWEGYWNEDVVKKARECIENPNTMAVVYTTRTYYPFHKLINSMLESKGLYFDIVGLCPDPVEQPKNRWEVTNREKLRVKYNQEEGVFSNTTDYTSSFVINIMQNVLTIKSVLIVTASTSAVERVIKFLRKLQMFSGLNGLKVDRVNKIFPPYNPVWQMETVTKIIDDHNLVLEAMYKGADSQGWDTPQENIIRKSHERFIEVSPHKINTCIEVLPECTARLKKIFEPIFKRQLERFYDKFPDSRYGEQPVFFGDTIRLHENKLLKHACCGVLGNEVTMKVTAFSPPLNSPYFILKVETYKNHSENHFHTLPLWFRPSQEATIVRKKRKWIPCSTTLDLRGITSYESRLLVSKPHVPPCFIPKKKKKEKLKPKDIVLPFPDEMDKILNRSDQKSFDTQKYSDERLTSHDKKSVANNTPVVEQISNVEKSITSQAEPNIFNASIKSITSTEQSSGVESITATEQTNIEQTKIVSKVENLFNAEKKPNDNISSEQSPNGRKRFFLKPRVSERKTKKQKK